MPSNEGWNGGDGRETRLGRGSQEITKEITNEDANEDTQANCAEVMASAREQLRRCEGNAKMYQGIDSQLEHLKLELDVMHAKTLALRVQTAINGNRLVRLDNPIVMAKMEALQQQLEDLMMED